MITLSKTYRFKAYRQVATVGESADRLNNLQLRVEVKGSPNIAGIVIDFNELDRIVKKKVLDRFEGKRIFESGDPVLENWASIKTPEMQSAVKRVAIIGGNPTLEMIAIEIYDILRDAISALDQNRFWIDAVELTEETIGTARVKA